MEDDFLIVPSGPPDSYCRLCLSENNVEMLLFAGTGFSQPNQKLLDLIRRHVAIGLTAPADSPCGICTTCRMMLEEFERFRERCLRCDYVLTGVDRQRSLMMMPFECSQCPSTFRYKSEFERHWKSIHDLCYRCEVCDAAFSTQSMLNSHSKFHDGSSEVINGEMYQCSYCPRMFPTDRQLRFHVQVLHEPRPSNDQVPSSASPARKKRKTTSAQEAPPASAPMVSINIMANPSASEPDSTKPYECKTCQVRFHFIGSLTRHISDVHQAQSQQNKKTAVTQRRKKPASQQKAPAAAPQPAFHEPMIIVDEPDPAPVMAELRQLVTVATTSVPMPSIPPGQEPIVPDIGPDQYGQLPVPNGSEYMPELITADAQLGYMPYGDQQPQDDLPIVYPCFIVMERLDENLFPPIENSEIPLGKYYHAMQKKYAAAPAEDQIDDDFLQNYPSYTKNIKRKRFACDLCSTDFTSRMSLTRHKQSKHSMATFPCTYCSMVFPNQGGLDRHMPQHTNEYPHVCEFCPLGFTRPAALRKHKERYHVPGAPPQKLHYCPYCSRAFNKLQWIKNHVMQLHGDQYEQTASEYL